MLKSLLIAIDETAASKTAQDIALVLARSHGATIDGLAVLDKPWIEEPRARPIGTGYYHHHRSEALTKSFTEKLDTLTGAFRSRCQEAGLTFQLDEQSRAPVEAIELESEVNDLVILGRDTTFHFMGDAGPSDTVMRLIRDNPRPLLVVPPASKFEGDILVAYDGSFAASRALHTFILLGMAQDRPVRVLCIQNTEADAARIAGRAVRLLDNHNINAEAIAIGSDRSVEEIIAEQSRNAAMIVLGAYGKSKLREFFFGTSTHKLLAQGTVPLFIDH